MAHITGENGGARGLEGAVVPLTLVHEKSSTLFDVIQLLENKKTPNVHVDVVKAILDCGGYVAGGAARRVALMHRARQTFDKNAWDEQSWQFVNSFQDGSDIDFFFPTEAAFRLAWSKCANMPSQAQSVTGAALQFKLGIAKYQLIKFAFAPADEMLQTFDITNASVAFTGDTMTYPSNWDDLEREKLLGVNAWSSPHTVIRVARYCSRHKMKLEPASREKFVTFALTQVQKLYAAHKAGAPPRDGQPTHKQAISWLATMLPTFSNEELVLLASMFSEPKYNWALHELCTRSQVCTLPVTQKGRMT